MIALAIRRWSARATTLITHKRSPEEEEQAEQEEKQEHESKGKKYKNKLLVRKAIMGRSPPPPVVRYCPQVTNIPASRRSIPYYLPGRI